MHHRIWDCDGIDELRDDQTTEAMRERARKAPRGSPYWTRGLAANPWRSLRPPRRDYEERWFFAEGVEEDRTFTGKVYSDGSAMAPQCPEARRAGWSVVQLAGDGTVSKAVYGHLPAPETSSQTAGAGEIYACRRAHELAVAGISATVDYQALLDGVSAGEKLTTASKKANAAGWRGIWRATDGERPNVVKVKAHQTFAEASRSEEPGAIMEWRGNRAADHFAKQGARQHYRGGGDAAFKHFEDEYERLAEVCKWIGTALAQWPRASAGKRACARRRGEQAAATKRARRRAAAEGNGHRLVRDRDGWKCLTCGRGAIAEKGARKLVSSRCDGHTGSRVGQQGSSPSAHTLWAAEADPSQVGKTGTLPPDIVWCSKCGGYSSTKLYKLGTVCSGVLQRAAQDRLGWINRGRHPVNKHLLSPPVRLTDAVIAALGEGAAARKAAFNALLRGEPRQDHDGRASHPHGGPRQVGDRDIRCSLSQEQLTPFYDNPTHDDDLDVFGHGGGLSSDDDSPGAAGGTAAGAKRTHVSTTTCETHGPDLKKGRGASPTDADAGGRNQGSGAAVRGDGQGNMPGSSTDHLGDHMERTRWGGANGGGAAYSGAKDIVISAARRPEAAAGEMECEPGAKRRRIGDVAEVAVQGGRCLGSDADVRNGGQDTMSGGSDGHLASGMDQDGLDGVCGGAEGYGGGGALMTSVTRDSDVAAIAGTPEREDFGRGAEHVRSGVRKRSPGQSCRVRGTDGCERLADACPESQRHRGNGGVCDPRCTSGQCFKRRRLRGKQSLRSYACPIVTPGASESPRTAAVDQPVTSDRPTEGI